MSGKIEGLSSHVVHLVTRPRSVGHPSDREDVHGTPFVPFLSWPSRSIDSSTSRTG